MNRTRCWIEISQSAIKYNIEQLNRYLKGQCRQICVIKANGYGHGAILMAHCLQEYGITDFGVAYVLEAEQLRDSGITGDILILSYTDRDNWMKAYDLNCIMSVVSVENAIELNRFAEEHGIKIRVEIKVDTGMRRLGTDSQCSDEDIRTLYGQPNLIVNGTFTHLASGDSFAEIDKAFTRLQNERFSGFLNRVRQLGYDTGRTHLCASSGILNYPEFKYDYCRPGFILYGYDVGEVIHGYDRKPVLSMYSRIEHIKYVDPSEGISYGRLYYTDGRRKIATVSCGYADGYPRRLTGTAYVLVKGQKVPVVGRICMDQFMIDVTGIEDIHVEDKVTLIGKDGNQQITVEDVSGWADTIGSDLCCGFSARVNRNLVD